MHLKICGVMPSKHENLLTFVRTVKSITNTVRHSIGTLSEFCRCLVVGVKWLGLGLLASVT